MIICENCGKEHDGSYGSGRFCSSKCARGFSTKSKRQEISKKVSKKLKSTFCYIYYTVCKCGKLFIRSRNGIKYCSLDCRYKFKEKYKVKDSSRMGGLREGGGHQIILSYISKNNGILKLNKDEIEVVKILEKLDIKFKRNKIGFPYLDLNGKNRKYYPDFYLPDFDLYLEYKGWETEKMIHKMNDAQKRNKFKFMKICSLRYAKNNLSLDDIIKEPNILLNELKKAA